MGGKKGFNKLLGYMEASKSKTKLAVVMGQEHNARGSEFQALREAAQIRGFQLIITSGYADNTQSSRGGVFVMINTNVLSVKKNCGGRGRFHSSKAGVGVGGTRYCECVRTSETGGQAGVLQHAYM